MAKGSDCFFGENVTLEIDLVLFGVERVALECLRPRTSECPVVVLPGLVFLVARVVIGELKMEVMTKRHWKVSALLVRECDIV